MVTNSALKRRSRCRPRRTVLCTHRRKRRQQGVLYTRGSVRGSSRLCAGTIVEAKRAHRKSITFTTHSLCRTRFREVDYLRSSAEDADLIGATFAFARAVAVGAPVPEDTVCDPRALVKDLVPDTTICSNVVSTASAEPTTDQLT